MEKPTTLHLLTNPVEAYDEYLLIKPKSNFDLFNHQKTSNALRMLERTLELLHGALRDLGDRESIYGMTRKELEDQVNHVYAEKLDLEQYVDAETTSLSAAVKGKLPLVDSDDDAWITSDWKPRGCISSVWDLETTVPMKAVIEKMPTINSDGTASLKELVRDQPRLWYELEASVVCRDYHQMFLDLTSEGICASLYLYNGRRNSCCTMSVQPTLLSPIADDAAVVIVTLRQYVKSCCADGITIVELYRYLGMMQPSYRMTLKSYDGRVFAHITRGGTVLSVIQV